MKTKFTNKLKIAAFSIAMLAAGTASAQVTTGDVTVQGNSTLGSTGTAVKLIDNKGTIKYMQAVNGLTSLTNTTPNGGEVTTWQLGGQLASDTYIDANGQAFALDGLELVTDLTTASTDLDADLHESDHGGTTTGFTVLIRDEATGKTQKIRVSDLIKVDGIRLEYTQNDNTDANYDAALVDANGTANAATPLTITGLPALTALTTAAKLFVYRNGVKLRFGTDFSVTADTVTLNSFTTFPMYAGDEIEIQYIK